MLVNQLIAETGMTREDASDQIAEVTADETDEVVFVRLGALGTYGRTCPMGLT
jgi:hypothetical protein